jgi:hypothetical protein
LGEPVVEEGTLDSADDDAIATKGESVCNKGRAAMLTVGATDGAATADGAVEASTD